MFALQLIAKKLILGKVGVNKNRNIRIIGKFWILLFELQRIHYGKKSSVAEIVQGLWIGPKLSSMEKLCIHSFLKHGHPFHLYAYDQIEGVPSQAKLCDANEIVPASRIFFYSQHNSCSGFANMFRYKLLLERGGWWVDMDTVCLQTLNFSNPYVFSSESTAAGTVRESGYCANTGIIRTPSNTELMRYCWDHCDRADHRALQWGETGPKLFARALEVYSLGHFVQQPSVFCPIPFNEWSRALEPGPEWKFSAETKAVHLWNEMWRRNNRSKDASYDPSCLYERLKSRYLNGAENGAG